MLSRISPAPNQSQLELQDLSKRLKDKIRKARELANSGRKDLQPSSQQQLTLQFDQTLANLQQLQPPEFDPKLNYFEQYWKMYLQNEINFNLIKDIELRTAHLHQLVNQIDTLQDEHYRLNRLINRKKNRRLACQIQKSYMCPYQKCNRIYGSDVSLNLHIKLKHNGGNKTDRQKLAQKICQAEQNGWEMPFLNLNLPPGYLREYRKLYFQKDFQEQQLTFEVKRQENQSSS